MWKTYATTNSTTTRSIATTRTTTTTIENGDDAATQTTNVEYDRTNVSVSIRATWPTKPIF